LKEWPLWACGGISSRKDATGLKENPWPGWRTTSAKLPVRTSGTGSNLSPTKASAAAQIEMNCRYGKITSTFDKESCLIKIRNDHNQKGEPKAEQNKRPVKGKESRTSDRYEVAQCSQ